MEISKNIAANIRWYKQERDLSVLGLAEELHLAASSTQEYLSGNSPPVPTRRSCWRSGWG